MAGGGSGDGPLGGGILEVMSLTAASIPGLWFALTTADVGVSRSTVGFDAPGDGAISAGWYIFTSPWLLPHSSAAVMISACSAASSSSQPHFFCASRCGR